MQIPTRAPTDEQIAILDALANGDDNLMINAYAGTGKTTMLEMIQAASKKQPVLAIAFNKRASDEMAERFETTTTCRTFNSLGHRILMKAIPNKLNLSSKKCGDILREHIKAQKKSDQDELWSVYWQVLEGVNLAKAIGYVPEGKFTHVTPLSDWNDLAKRLEEVPTPLCRALIDHVLTISIQTAYQGWIDFNDQVYMPALFLGTFPRFPLVLVDEAQDANRVNHQMLHKLVKGRLGVVGDRWQSIYAFRGATTGGMDILKSKFSCTEYDLSVSFRCPRAVVEAAQWRVPLLKWKKEGGHVEVLNRLNAKDIQEGATILCRNNAPLFRAALGLLVLGKSVTVSGSEIGPKLVRLLEKICDEDDTQSQMLGKIKEWEAEKLEHSQHPDRIRDEAACLTVFANFGKTLGTAVAYIEDLFKRQGQIKLMTGHKAKGGEWPIVYHLNPWMCKDHEQDMNLRYVITTRSEDQLYEIDDRDIKW